MSCVRGGGGTGAIVLDVDDTTLATWNYEVASNWAYNATTNADYVLGQKFPAVPGMVALATAAERAGYAIFYLTGRGSAQYSDVKGGYADRTFKLPNPNYYLP